MSDSSASELIFGIFGVRSEDLPPKAPLVLVSGVVKHYNAEKRFGFIRLDVARPDQKDVFFHRNNGQDVHEQELGTLDFAWRNRLHQDPEKGDRVCLYVEERDKGPAAVSWTYKAVWDERQRVIDARPHPEQPYSRVVDCSHEDRENEVLWEGPSDQMDGYLTAAATDLDARKRVMIERRYAHGWEQHWHDKYCGVSAAIGFMTEEELLRGLEGLNPPSGAAQNEE